MRKSRGLSHRVVEYTVGAVRGDGTSNTVWWATGRPSGYSGEARLCGLGRTPDEALDDLEGLVTKFFALRSPDDEEES
jgi:hypothetical protein